jgi:hypothetical protein
MLWTTGRLTDFWATVDAELAPVIRAVLQRDHRLTLEEAEDCLSPALQGLVERQATARRSVRNPQAYIWRSALSAAVVSAVIQ